MNFPDLGTFRSINAPPHGNTPIANGIHGDKIGAKGFIRHEIKHINCSHPLWITFCCPLIERVFLTPYPSSNSWPPPAFSAQNNRRIVNRKLQEMSFQLYYLLRRPNERIPLGTTIDTDCDCKLGGKWTEKEREKRVGDELEEIHFCSFQSVSLDDRSLITLWLTDSISCAPSPPQTNGRAKSS